MKTSFRVLFILFISCLPLLTFSQHRTKIDATLNERDKTIDVSQQIEFYNQTGDTLESIVLNDWNHAYSSKTTPLAKRFSDEFVRSFHLAKEHERGSTNNLSISTNNIGLEWQRSKNQPDVVDIKLQMPLLPNQRITLSLSYQSKIPSARFTKYGYTDDHRFNLRYWALSVARFEDGKFIRYSNNNIDDIANSLSDFELTLRVPKGESVATDLNEVAKTDDNEQTLFKYEGKNRFEFSLFIERESSFHSFRNKDIEVQNGFKDDKVDDVDQAILIDRIISFVHENVGDYPHAKITVSQTDYDRNPFYGLNQLPSFLSPFSGDFVYEIKFLKTYLNNYLKNSLNLDSRKDNWIYDGIQIYIMMKYIDEYRPDSKMFGGLSSLRLLQSYRLANLSFNDQYSYFYMLMARKNLDQPLGAPKNTLIKFNEQIASKYRAGLSFRYLDDYLQTDAVPQSIKDFYKENQLRQTNQIDFENVVKGKTSKNIDWFFETVINSREIIDYKFTRVLKDDSTVVFTLRNKTGTTVPIPVYGVKNGEVVFKQWVENVKTDSTISVPRRGADKIVINFQNEVPEYNQRNNWRSLSGYALTNRPLRFNVMKDLEDPELNQILYVPTLTYNLYDGLSPGIRFHNKTILEKPVTFDVNPIFSPNTRSLTGNFSLNVNQNYRETSLYHVRYGVSGSYFHYAPDAAYTKFTPTVQFRFRDANFRSNRRQVFQMRQVIVHRDPTLFDINSSESFQNYAVFNARFVDSKTEVIKHFSYYGDLQISQKFGKLGAEVQYRRFFEDNRQINIRLYAGKFLYNKTNSDFFSFALDRPTDYLFDYNYYGRSESTGFFSQQLILSEGGFKSVLDTPFANEWIATTNVSYSIWNWIEAYGDLGMVKNRNQNPKTVYDTGIRLNLVTDYFELYFPIYSNNGWEIGQDNYQEKIRFIVTFDPKALVNLFTRKWF